MSEWVLSNQTRRQAWKIWLFGMLPVLALLIAQTVAGAWEGAVARAWTWLLLLLIPGSALLLAGLLLARKSKHLVPQSAHRALLTVTALYGLLCLVSLFAGTFGDSTLSAIERLEQSFWWLAPLQAILLGGYYIAFFRQDSLFHPNEQAIRQTAEKLAADSEKQGKKAQAECRKLLAAAALPEAMDFMRQKWKNNQALLDELLLQEAQYNRLAQDLEQGMVEQEQAQVQIRRITKYLLNLSEQIPD